MNSTKLDVTKLKEWINQTFKGTFPFLLPINTDHSVLYRDEHTQVVVPSLTTPQSLATFRNELTDAENHDLTIAIIRSNWPNLTSSDIGELDKIFLAKNSP